MSIYGCSVVIWKTFQRSITMKPFLIIGGFITGGHVKIDGQDS